MRATLADLRQVTRRRMLRAGPPSKGATLARERLVGDVLDRVQAVAQPDAPARRAPPDRRRQRGVPEAPGPRPGRARRRADVPVRGGGPMVSPKEWDVALAGGDFTGETELHAADGT